MQVKIVKNKHNESVTKREFKDLFMNFIEKHKSVINAENLNPSLNDGVIRVALREFQVSHQGSEQVNYSYSSQLSLLCNFYVFIPCGGIVINDLA